MTDAATDYPLFAQPWWLDAVAPGGWDHVVVRRGEEVAARLPFVPIERVGLRMLGMPPLTGYLGPCLRASTANYAKQLDQQKELMQELIEQLPRHDLFKQNFMPEVHNWLPFHWAGFTATPRCVYRIDLPDDVEALWDECQGNIRREIRKAQKQLSVRDDLEVDQLCDVVAKAFDRQGLASPYPRQILQRVWQQVQQRGCGKMIFAEDADGIVHAGALIVWDRRAAYYLVAGGDPAHRTSGAGSLVMWHALQHAASICELFDFQGSMRESIERFFRGFGGRQHLHLLVERTNRRGSLAMGLRHFAGALQGRRP